jgi:hypothetical protein
MKKRYILALAVVFTFSTGTIAAMTKDPYKRQRAVIGTSRDFECRRNSPVRSFVGRNRQACHNLRIAGYGYSRGAPFSLQRTDHTAVLFREARDLFRRSRTKAGSWR